MESNESKEWQALQRELQELGESDAPVQAGGDGSLSRPAGGKGLARHKRSLSARRPREHRAEEELRRDQRPGAGEPAERDPSGPPEANERRFRALFETVMDYQASFEETIVRLQDRIADLEARVHHLESGSEGSSKAKGPLSRLLGR